MPVDRLHKLLKSCQFKQALEQAEQLALNPDLEPALKAKVYIAGVKAAAGLRNLYAGAKLAEKAIEAAELGCDWEDVGNARYYSSLIFGELGDTAQAMQFLDLFFLHLDRYPSLIQRQGAAYYHKGFFHQQRKEFNQADSAYQTAVQFFRERGDSVWEVRALHNAAWAMLVQERTPEARTYLNQAERLLESVDMPELGTTHLVIDALYSFQTGFLEKAKAQCEEVFQPGRPGVSERQLTQASWIMARLSLKAGVIREAGIFADLAVGYALRAKEPYLMNLASDVRKRVILKKGELTARRQ